MERSAKKVFQRSNWSRKGKSLGKVAEGSEAIELEAARVFLKMRQTRNVDGQSSK